VDLDVHAGILRRQAGRLELLERPAQRVALALVAREHLGESALTLLGEA
jgi:hypothetical protein